MMPTSKPANASCHVDRRRFLGGITAFSIAALAAAEDSPPDRRSLSFVHTHTGETLSTIYFQNGNYLTPSLEHINHFLRDFRTTEVHSRAARCSFRSASKDAPRRAL